MFSSLDEIDFELLHESRDAQPKIAADGQDALHPPAVALPQGLHYGGILLAAVGMHPLLEMVEHQEHLALALRQAFSLPQLGQRVFQPKAAPQRRATLAERFQQPRLGFVGRRFDVDRQHRADKCGISPALISDDFPQPEGPVNQAHAGTSCPRRFPRCAFSRSGCCPACRCGPADREAGSERNRRPRSERPQALRHDLQRPLVGRGCAGRRRPSR